MKELFFEIAQEWRDWLALNHDKEDGIWLIYLKQATGRPSIDYESSVEEALCFGWIDSIIKRLDESRYARKFTPRKDDSKWSDINKKRTERLIRDKRMTEAGLAKIVAAQQNGQWDKPDRPNINFAIPPDFKRALSKNKKAEAFFEQLAPSYKKQYIGWIAVAKQSKTKERRIKESLELLERGKKLGMK